VTEATTTVAGLLRLLARVIFVLLSWINKVKCIKNICSSRKTGENDTADSWIYALMTYINLARGKFNQIKYTDLDRTAAQMINVRLSRSCRRNHIIKHLIFMVLIYFLLFYAIIKKKVNLFLFGYGFTVEIEQ
jgi:hypothetical protein